jgi:hypothetical protein
MKVNLKEIFKFTAISFTISFALINPSSVSSKENGPSLRIVKDGLLEMDNFYFVKGVINNPYNRAVKNVRINYFIWKKWMGKDGHGSVIKETGGLVSATIKYLPPKQSVEFAATGDDSAPVMTVESGLLPDPINAQISAEWAE